MKQRTQYRVVKDSSSQQADRAIGGHHTVFGGQPEERSLLGSHGMHLRPSPRAGGPGGAKTPPRFKWIAHTVTPQWRAARSRGASTGEKREHVCASRCG